jgi:hypothetical protein
VLDAAEDDIRNDGGKIQYLRDSDKWRKYDPALFDVMKWSTEGALVADQVGAVLDPGPFALRCSDIDFLAILICDDSNYWSTRGV